LTWGSDFSHPLRFPSQARSRFETTGVAAGDGGLYDEVTRKGRKMTFLVTICILLGVPVSLAIALAMRGRRSGRAYENQIDANKANSLTITFPDLRTGGEYLPPDDDGLPLH
jgi:hypothetical protein